jgi:hypothetical protein
MRARSAILALVAGVVLLTAPAAGAVCGDAERFGALTARRQPPPLAIGDSVMLGAVEPLRRSGFDIDVRGCRSMAEGLEVLAARGASLPRVVVMALGDNFPIELGDIARARVLLGPSRVLALVTPSRSASSRAAILTAARRWPARVRVLDWAAVSGAQPSWTWDGLHLTPAGAEAFAGLLRRAYDWPLPHPSPAGPRAAVGGVPASEGSDHGHAGRGFVLVLVLFALVGVLMGGGSRRAPAPRR